MVTYLSGDIFGSSAQTLVVPVNTVGAMGAGLALAFKQKYPGLDERYQWWLRVLSLDKIPPKAGDFFLVQDVDPDRMFLLFATKTHWKDSSSLDPIKTGLKCFADALFFKDSFPYETSLSKIKSAAFPALGCGSGGLNWEVVKPIMHQQLSRLDIPVEIFEPGGNR